MHSFDSSIQEKVEIIDPSTSFYLRIEVDIMELTKWVTYVDLEVCEMIFIPYHEK